MLGLVLRPLLRSQAGKVAGARESQSKDHVMDTMKTRQEPMDCYVLVFLFRRSVYWCLPTFSLTCHCICYKIQSSIDEEIRSDSSFAIGSLLELLLLLD